jgi:DtxR family Mn-dependent transcriptional regulator
MPSPATEDYLKAIYALERAGQRATTSILAARLGVQPASVTGMIKRLTEMALVSHTPYGAATLTPEGRRAALSVIRNHRLVERFLVDTLGVPWDAAHHEAHKLEHAVSDMLADRIEDFLGHPTTCPHGSPIPTPNGEVAEPTQVPLTDLPVGQTAVVSEVDDEDAALLRHLNELGLIPGTEVEPLAVAPFDGPITLRIADQERPVGSAVAHHVWVQPTGPHSQRPVYTTRKD